MTSVVRHKRGDTLKLVFQWRAEADSDSDPIDLTDCSARFQIRSKCGTLVATATSDTGEITVGGVSGDVGVRIESDVMQTVAKGSYRCDLELTFPDETVLSSDTLTLVIVDDQTKPEDETS